MIQHSLNTLQNILHILVSFRDSTLFQHTALITLHLLQIEPEEGLASLLQAAHDHHMLR